MEIEVSGIGNIQQIIWASLLVLVVLLGAVGYVYTTTDASGYPSILTLQEWQIIQAERAYKEELARLRSELDNLAQMVNERPDPVRAQINLERISRQYGYGQPALEQQRAVILQAAQSVEDWAVGAAPLEKAQESVSIAADLLQPEIKAIEQQEQQQEEQKQPDGFLMFLPLIRK